MDGAFLDWALETFAGDVADALYEGPSGVLAVVANRQDKRIRYDVLDHDPSHEEIPALLRRLKRAWDERG
jgi:hypothetical protein